MTQEPMWEAYIVHGEKVIVVQPAGGEAPAEPNSYIGEMPEEIATAVVATMALDLQYAIDRRTPPMSPLVEHAERELRLAGMYNEDADYGAGAIAKQVLELIRVLAGQGHSGMSAAYTLELFIKLANREALTPLTNDPAEWEDRSEISGFPLWQNRRDSTYFSSDGGQTWYTVRRQYVELVDRETEPIANTGPFIEEEAAQQPDLYEGWVLHASKVVQTQPAGLGVPVQATVASDGTIGGTIYPREVYSGVMTHDNVRAWAEQESRRHNYPIEDYDPFLTTEED